MRQSREFETIVIGGGQAGLSVSYHLKLEGQNHIVLEQAARPANAWRNHRWDSFVLNNPNWQSQLPGAGIPRNDPDGFLSRDQLVSYFEEYIQQNRLPLRYDTQVVAVMAGADGYAVETSAGRFRAQKRGRCNRHLSLLARLTWWAVALRNARSSASLSA
jgi:putative flavoprotein involved in K+ transport